MKILACTARGRLSRAKAGYPPARTVPLGYRYVKHTDKGSHYEIAPDTAVLMRRIFTLYITPGYSLKRIATTLTREGVPPPAQRRRGPGGWHISTVNHILSNTADIGRLYDGKYQRIAGKTNPDKKTRWRAVPRAEWTEISVPPIIDHALFDATQAQLARNAQTSRRNRKYDYLFVGGRLQCGQCGRSLSGYLDVYGHRWYRCTLEPYQDGGRRT